MNTFTIIAKAQGDVFNEEYTAITVKDAVNQFYDEYRRSAEIVYVIDGSVTFCEVK